MAPEITIELVRNDVNAVVDKTIFDKVIGQTQARKTIQFFINSHQPSSPFPTLLLTGGHGLGKSMFGELISKSLFREFIEVNCGQIKTESDFMDIVYSRLLDDRRPATILFDEAHKLSSEITTMLLTLLNPNKRHTNKLEHRGINMIWDLRSINCLFATTDAYMIFRPLRNRCQEVYFYPYSDGDLFKIVQLYLPGVKIQCSRSDLAIVCRSRARDAYILSNNIKRYLSIKTSNQDVLTQNDLNELKDMLGIMKLGLKKSEVDLLQAVYEFGPISASNLATRLMVNQNNIEEELEIRLRELGLIQSTTKGRIITEQGKEYLENL